MSDNRTVFGLGHVGKERPDIVVWDYGDEAGEYKAVVAEEASCIKELPPLAKEIEESISQDDRRFAQWWNIQRKFLEISHFLTDLSKQKRFEGDFKGETFNEARLITYEFLFRAASCFLVSDLCKKLDRLGKGGKAEETLRKYARLVKYGTTSEMGSIRIGNACLLEILPENSKSKLSAPDIYNYIVQAVTLDPEEILKMQPEDELKKRWPAIALFGPISLSYFVVGLSSFSQRDIEGLVRTSTNAPPRQISQYVKRLYETVNEAVEDFYKIILDPDNKEFDRAKAILANFLAGNEAARMTAIFELGLRSRKRLFDLCRRATEYVRENKEKDFYQLLLEGVEEFMDKFEVADLILTKEDADSLFEVGSLDLDQRTDFDSLRVSISSIISKTSSREFEIDPDTVNWGTQAKPALCLVEFDKDKPFEFKVYLGYEGYQEESLTLAFHFDVKRGTFDWNFIESPTDPEMLVYRNVVLLTCSKILERLSEGVALEYAEKRKPQQVAPKVVGEKEKRERYVDETYELRKRMREEIKSRTVPVPISFSEIRREETSVKSTILLPEEDVFEGMLQNVYLDSGQVREGIERFNEVGGKLGRKRSRGREGQALYSLRVGDIRVLLSEASSDEGIRNFNILDIRNRKDVYRKAGI